MKKRWLLFLAIVLCLGFSLTPLVQSQEKYPNKPITFIIPFGPGGASDLCWRVFLEDLRAELGVPVTGVNKPGAGGLTGADFVANSKPDGYTLLAANNTCMAVSPAIDPKAYRDLVPLGVVANQGILVVTRSDHEVKTLEEMISRAKAKPDSLTVGSTGVTASTYFDLALLEVASGTSFSHVPVPKSSEGIAMLLGGHIDFWFGTFSIAQNLMKAGRLRGIATAMTERLPAFPDIPTFAEKGYPDVNLNLDMILYAPKGTAPEVIKTWENALTVVMKKPHIKAALEKVNFEVDFRLGSEKILKSLNETREKLEKIAKAKGIKPGKK
jgi:tripartite-type tricarboxylate transporter receptor subunit TctC